MRNILIKRDILQELKLHLGKREIMLLVGPRQAGKTTIMYLIRDYLAAKDERTLFLSLDFEEDKKHFLSQRALIERIKLEFGQGRGFVFIDEIQRKDDAGVFLKGIYDLRLPYKFIVSGSGSLELKEKIHESLAGRKMFFEINPISFREFVNFKTDYRYETRLSDFFNIEESKAKILADEYMNFGGYPRVILEEMLSDKQRIVDEIFRSYIERDIAFWLGVEKTDAFSNLVKILAAQAGNQTNYAELSNALGISYQTVKNFLWYLEKTFVVRKVSPYSRNKRKEITKAPIFYFIDIGLRNYSRGNFGRLDTDLRDKGFVFENFIFHILSEELRLSNAPIHYWRTKDGAEVDFVIDFGDHLLPIEVKFSEFREPKIERSMKSFIDKYKPVQAFVINKNLRETLDQGKTKIRFLPFTDLLAKSVLKDF